VKLRIPTLLTLALLTACSRKGEMADAGGVYVTRSACPSVAIPAGTGDVTLFNPPGNTTAGAVDVSATITNLRATCNDSGSEIVSVASFDVVATRRDAGPARTVVLPYFDVVVQGGTNVVAKKVGQLALNFAAGSQRARTNGQATARVSQAAATIPADVRRLLTRPRKAGEAEAAIDPLSDPKVREAVANASFEQLVGFQLTQDQLRYNVTR
jgi:hypothetical protein